jgi:hypothetical protein
MIAALAPLVGTCAFAATAPTNDIFHHTYRSGETISRSIIHVKDGVFPHYEFRGTSTLVADAVSPDSVTFKVNMTNKADTAHQTLQLDQRTLHVVDADTRKDLTGSILALYNASLFGRPAGQPSVGETWSTSVGFWYYGPPGTSTVRIDRFDPKRCLIRMNISGSGFGTIGDDVEHPRNLVVSVGFPGSATEVIRREGKSSWAGFIEIEDGVVQHERLQIDTEVTTPAISNLPASTGTMHDLIQTDIISNRT